MSYQQLQKQVARQKLLSTIISFTSVECAVYVIDATAETIRRTVDNVSPLPSFFEQDIVLPTLWSTLGDYAFPVAALQARNISAGTPWDSTNTESTVHWRTETFFHRCSFDNHEVYSALAAVSYLCVLLYLNVNIPDSFMLITKVSLSLPRLCHLWHVLSRSSISHCFIYYS